MQKQQITNSYYKFQDIYGYVSGMVFTNSIEKVKKYLKKNFQAKKDISSFIVEDIANKKTFKLNF